MNNTHSHPKKYHLIVIFEDETKQEVLKESIEEIDRFTMKYANGNSLVTDLIKQDKLEDKNIDRIIINYKADEKIKEVPVLYSNDKNKVNTDYVERKIHHYSSDKGFFKDFLTKYAKMNVNTNNRLKDIATNLYVNIIQKETNLYFDTTDLIAIRENIFNRELISNSKFNNIRYYVDNAKMDISDNYLANILMYLNSSEFYKSTDLEELIKILIYNSYKKCRDNYLIVKNYEIIIGQKEDDTEYGMLYQKKYPSTFENNDNADDVLAEIERNEKNGLLNHYILPDESIEPIKDDEKEVKVKQKTKKMYVNPDQLKLFND